MNQNPHMWGPSYWRFLHYFALHSQTTPEFVKTLKSLIPCLNCQEEWFDPELNRTMVEWSLVLHNKVNTKLGRYDKWNLTDFSIAHKPTCDVCNPPPRPVFPWLFIHALAETGAKEAKSFLLEFNTQYPCISCRNTFFTDEPAENESVLDWTIRHHIRKEPLFVYKPKAKDCKICPDTAT